MDWARILAYVTGTVDQELLARNEYLAAENRILKAQLNGRLRLSDADRATRRDWSPPGSQGFRYQGSSYPNQEVTDSTRPATITADELKVVQIRMRNLAKRPSEAAFRFRTPIIGLFTCGSHSAFRPCC